MAFLEISGLKKRFGAVDILKGIDLELEKGGLHFSRQVAIPVKYEGQLVGDFVADIVVAGSVLIELKAVRALEEVHFAQCMNCLKATGLPLCLLVNFGTPHVHVRRIVNEF